MTQLNEQAVPGNATARILPVRPAGGAASPLPASFSQATGAPAVTANAPAATNGMAVAALILGIASIPFCWWGIASLAMVVLAIVFGSIGIRRANAGAPQKNFAVVGLCCGIVGLMAYLIIGVVTFGLGLLI
jgi:hypothetical protein